MNSITELSPPVRTLKIEADGDLSFLRDVPGVAAVTPPGEGTKHWEVSLARGAEPQVVLAACFERGIKLTRFDSSPPTLHEIFVSLAGGHDEGTEP